MKGYQPKNKEKHNLKNLSLPKEDFGTRQDLNRHKDETIQSELKETILNLMNQLNNKK